MLLPIRRVRSKNRLYRTWEGRLPYCRHQKFVGKCHGIHFQQLGTLFQDIRLYDKAWHLLQLLTYTRDNLSLYIFFTDGEPDCLKKCLSDLFRNCFILKDYYNYG